MLNGESKVGNFHADLQKDTIEEVNTLLSLNSISPFPLLHACLLDLVNYTMDFDTVFINKQMIQKEVLYL